MSLMVNQLEELAQLAVTAAKAAGTLINEYRHRSIEVQQKERGDSLASQVVTEADHKAQKAIIEILQPTLSLHDLALLAEETEDDGQRHEKAAFWSIDPMDGTLAFINNAPGFSVSIALVAHDGTPLIGVVYDPLEQNLMHAIQGRGAYINGAPIQIPELDQSQPLILQTDASFQSHPWLESTHLRLHEIAAQLGLNGAEIHYRTGAVLNACSILQQPNRCYFKYPRLGNSGGSLWDYAATAALYRECGAVASDIYGDPLELNRTGSTFMNHNGLVYAATATIAEQIYSIYRELSAE